MSNITNSQLGELFYTELLGSFIPSGPFNNVQSSAYLSGTERESNPNNAYLFWPSGWQGTTNKNSQFYAWAVSPGQMSAVPLPGAVWLFGSALVGFLGLKRRKNIG